MSQRPNRETYVSLRRTLLEARHAASMTQAELARRLKRPQSFVSKFENGERNLDVVEFIDVCVALGASPHEVIRSLMTFQHQG